MAGTLTIVASRGRGLFGIGEGRLRKRWINTISQDLISLTLTPVDVEDRDDWRRSTRVADR